MITLGQVLTLDRELEVPVYSSVCLRCTHLDLDAFVQGKHRCAAFPDGIPMPIWMGENNHQKPYPGDQGIRFEPRDVAKSQD